MRSVLLSFLAVALFLSCAHQPDSSGGRLAEVEAPWVADCTRLGVINETADAGDPFPFSATQKMIRRVKARAAQLGATHLVWLHKTRLSGSAEAYRCPAQ